jgi:uncharacterized protein YegP (UPF0339 family)
MRARRATIIRDAEGKYRYIVQAGNWFVIDESEQGFARKRSSLDRIDARWPNVEQVIDLTLT